ncbi:MAG: FKBP-type peptidyl-prolyl cis-trans isomerase [Bacteroidales bacterium]|nr:FKBP-type peptidyl-prolyl cis-trans isomerase [Bacteroidales bacterium]
MKAQKLFILIAVMCIAAVSCKKEELQIDKDTDVIKSYLNENNINAQDIDHVFYVENVVGTGEQCQMGDTVFIKYSYRSLKDPNKVLVSQLDIADQLFLPFSRTSSSSIIYGLQIGLPTMKEGGKTTFYIPASYAFGRDSLVTGETYANIIFDVELCEIYHRDKRH